MSNPSVSNNSGSDQSGRRIKTLYIKPWAGKLERYETLSHFSTFGDVENLQVFNETKCSYELVNNARVFNETKYSYGFVKFTQPESAAKALDFDSHIIGGRRVNVVVASDRHQGFTTLLDLNDDCILEILSTKCMTAMDLCSVAESCRRLQGIASRAFSRKHKMCDISSLSEGESESAKRILTNFGSEISDLQMREDKSYADKWLRKVLQPATEYCNLQSLDLHSFAIPGNFTVKLRPLFKNLQKLKIFSCTFNDASKELFSECRSLIELSIVIFRDAAASLFENTYPKLQRFECSLDVDSDLLASFISRHMNLKSIKMFGDIPSSVLQLIARCERLETLHCLIIQGDTPDLSNFGHLKELEISCYHGIISVKELGLDNLKFLEHLKLHRAEIDSEFIRTMAQLKRIRVLKLWHCTGLQNLNRVGNLDELTTLEIQTNEPFDLDIVPLVQRLQRLSKFNFENFSVRVGFEMSLELYLRIVDVVRRRPDKSKLTFRLRSYSVSYEHLLADFERNAHLVEMIVLNDV